MKYVGISLGLLLLISSVQAHPVCGWAYLLEQGAGNSQGEALQKMNSILDGEKDLDILVEKIEAASKNKQKISQTIVVRNKAGVSIEQLSLTLTKVTTELHALIQEASQKFEASKATFSEVISLENRAIVHTAYACFIENYFYMVPLKSKSTSQLNQEIIAGYNKAIELDPNFSQSYVRLGVYEQNLGILFVQDEAPSKLSGLNNIAKGLEIQKSNYEAKPSEENKRDLAETYIELSSSYESSFDIVIAQQPTWNAIQVVAEALKLNSAAISLYPEDYQYLFNYLRIAYMQQYLDIRLKLANKKRIELNQDTVEKPVILPSEFKDRIDWNLGIQFSKDYLRIIAADPKLSNTGEDFRFEVFEILSAFTANQSAYDGVVSEEEFTAQKEIFNGLNALVDERVQTAVDRKDPRLDLKAVQGRKQMRMKNQQAALAELTALKK